MVPATGLEPVRCYSLEPESSASANSATRAACVYMNFGAFRQRKIDAILQIVPAKTYKPPKWESKNSIGTKLLATVNVAAYKIHDGRGLTQVPNSRPAGGLNPAEEQPEDKGPKCDFTAWPPIYECEIVLRRPRRIRLWQRPSPYYRPKIGWTGCLTATTDRAAYFC